MGVFTEAEGEYLQGQTLGRLATVGPDGRPHIAPVTFSFNADEDAIDIGGIDFANTKKWRDAKQNPKVTFLVDDVAPDGAHAVEVRGDVEIHETGGSAINPRFPNFVEQFLRLRPRRIVSWGLDQPTGTSPTDVPVNARSVR
jgi:pyridoxamine 5'-phosphate oxidase family protein